LSKRTVPFPNYANKRLLVADDNKVNLKVITSLLGRFHIVPDTVENGQEVLDRLVLRDYDLILMDCQMPIMNGYEAAKHLRDLELSHQEATHIPIIAITADITGSDRQKCLSAGMDDFLTKPIVPDALATLLSCWLGDSGMHTAADSQKIQSTSIWNEAQVLKNLDDDEELLSDMITLFIEEVPHKLIDLNKSLQKMDLVRMIEVTHSLRGMTGHFCVKTTLEICDKLENAAQKSHLVDIASLTNELTASIKILMEKLRHRKGQIHG
jgi:CheY-like chemotaxis protein